MKTPTAEGDVGKGKFLYIDAASYTVFEESNVFTSFKTKNSLALWPRHPISEILSHRNKSSS
jgi:hypothetical protein